MSKIHYLKTEREYRYAVHRGEKNFEVRRNDRDFQVGDILILTPLPGETDTTSVVVRVEYLLPGGRFGIDPDFCVMSIRGFQIPPAIMGFVGIPKATS